MKFDISNPAFLQSACADTETPITRFSVISTQQQVLISCVGNIIVETFVPGEATQTSYSDLENEVITLNTSGDVVVHGKLTLLGTYPPYPHDQFTSVDITESRYIKKLTIIGSDSVTELDLKKNVGLRHLEVSSSGLHTLDVSKLRKLELLYMGNLLRVTNVNLKGLKLSGENFGGFGTERAYPLLQDLNVKDTSQYIQNAVREWFETVEELSVGVLRIDTYTSEGLVNAARERGWSISLE